MLSRTKPPCPPSWTKSVILQTKMHPAKSVLDHLGMNRFDVTHRSSNSLAGLDCLGWWRNWTWSSLKLTVNMKPWQKSRQRATPRVSRIRVFGWIWAHEYACWEYNLLCMQFFDFHHMVAPAFSFLSVPRMNKSLNESFQKLTKSNHGFKWKCRKSKFTVLFV